MLTVAALDCSSHSLLSSWDFVCCKHDSDRSILWCIKADGVFCQAILSMPFFDQNKWMGDVSRIWLWFVLAVPSTSLAFAFYKFWKSRHDAALRSKDLGAAEIVEILDP